MSAVHNNGREQARIARRAQTEYQKKEQELVKKHKKELARLNQRHVDDMRAAEERHKLRVDEVKDKSKASLTQKEEKFQTEISDIKDMHRERVRKMAYENERKLRNLNQTKTAEFDKFKEISNRQRLMEREQAKFEHQKVKNQFEEFVDKNQVEQRKAQMELRDKLQKIHAQERNTLLKNNEERSSNVIKDRDRVRQQMGNRIEELTTQIHRQKNTMSAEHFEKIKTEQSRHQDQIEARNIAFEAAREKMHKDYHDNLEKERQISEEQREHLKETVTSRQDNEVKVLEGRVTRLQADKSAKVQKLKNQMQAERDNLVSEFKKQTEIYERQKQEALEAYNDTNHADSKRVRDEYGKQFRALNKFHMERVEEMERRFNEQINSVMLDSESDREHNKVRSEARIERLKNKAESEAYQRENYHQSNLEFAKNDFQATLQEVRQKAIDEKNDIIQRYQKLIRENEQKSSGKLEKTIAEYEKELHGLREKHTHELRSLGRNQQRLFDQLAKKSNMERESQQMQYQESLVQTKDSHDEEIQRMNMRHEEEIQHLLAAIKNT